MASTRSRDEALCAVKQRGKELSTPILPHITGHLMADASTTAAWNHWERCAGLWEGDLLSLPSFGVPERAASLTAEHTVYNVIPSDCRCKALQATTDEACTDVA